MAGLIPQRFIDDLLNRTDILDVVSSRIQLKKTGKNYSACCPFHKEKTPSFTVSPDKQFYYCFGCGAGGNIFGFVQQKENLDFAAAVEFLADRYGVALEYEETDARGDAERRRRERLRGVLERATAHFARVLWESPAAAEARAYLDRRGLAEAVCREFRLGYSLPSWSALRNAEIGRASCRERS